MKKICYLGDANNSHVIKWCNFFKNKDYEIHVISLNGGDIDGVNVHNFQTNVNEVKNEKIYKKLSYLGHIKNIRSLVKKINPDILHAHYASSYGFIGTLLGHRPYIISVWGTDIYDFPRNGFIQKNIIKHNFKYADYIFTNSIDMAREVNLYTKKEAKITYFGVDVDKFRPLNGYRDEKYFTFGIVKSLEKKYGIKYLIDAFEMLYNRYSGELFGKKLRLKIGGEGNEKENLIQQISTLNSRDNISLLGRVPSHELEYVYNSCDVCVFPSLSEGFGVSVIEAEACAIPVIITRVGGHPETVIENETGLIVESNSAQELLNAMNRLLRDESLRNKLANNAREFVVENYSFEKNFEDIGSIYDEILSIK
ncbi:glycosyltransferase family 4 protein [Peptostreptococcus equinus]|uniref:Glycosyltransferase family 4 protein n=1 Tax=Peptostreptococcus equinus TaxID=3003601 RepID=A0ABY7JRS9_9FIRM|nr:glycosyltransferase family 4 protein [Peptostreptococcus sp. CBA3647]WAW14685.1 glycosyltransferase family 4 protein [Peptostreptococcus sp. CBA3647]